MIYLCSKNTCICIEFTMVILKRIQYLYGVC